MRDNPGVEQLQLFVPDRFDMLQRRAADQLENIVVPVDGALALMRDTSRDMAAAGRGAFLLFRGDSGSGKSTFLNTLDLFIEGVEIIGVPRETEIEGVLRKLPVTPMKLRLVVIEGRDALRNVSAPELEAAIHEINAFIRGARGERTLVVWPANADDLEAVLVDTASRVGADSLLGVGHPSYRFSGPSKEQFVEIAQRTIASLNQGATLADLGVSIERAKELVAQAATIGMYMALIRKDLVRNQAAVEELLEKERCRLWVIVAASNDPEGDIAGVTRGTFSAADIERLLGATNANIVEELKQYPNKLGILAAVLDAKVLHLPAVVALSVAREFGDKKLADAMTVRGLSTAATKDAIDRLRDSDVARAFAGAPMGTRARGPKAGSNTIDAFQKLADIASSNDELLNAALGRALEAGAFIESFSTERDFGKGLTRYTDILAKASGLGVVRLEVMWRKSTGRAEIANYVLTKLYNYGRAIGLLS